MVIVMSMIVMVTVMMMTNTSISSLDLTILCPEVATLMSTSLQSGRAASSFLSISPYMISLFFSAEDCQFHAHHVSHFQSNAVKSEFKLSPGQNESLCCQ